MDNFDEWLAEQESSILLTNQLFSAKKANLGEKVRKRYSSLFQYEDRIKKMAAFSASLSHILEREQEISWLLPRIVGKSLIAVDRQSNDTLLPVIGEKSDEGERLRTLANELDQVYHQLEKIANQFESNEACKRLDGSVTFK
jgi:hypothetical protein